ncbi:hypothetical protein ACFQU2_16830 [Siccirubricoccus deserti]
MLRNRHSVTWSLAYFAHSWELYAVRSWLIAFLAFAAAGQVPGSGWPAPAQVAFGASVLGIFSIVLGGECSIQLGRKRTVLVLMSLSAATGAALGILGEQLRARRDARPAARALDDERERVRHRRRLGQRGPRLPRRHHGAALNARLRRRGVRARGVRGGAGRGGGSGVPGAWSWAFAVLAAVTLAGPSRFW